MKTAPIPTLQVISLIFEEHGLICNCTPAFLIIEPVPIGGSSLLSTGHCIAVFLTDDELSAIEYSGQEKRFRTRAKLDKAAKLHDPDAFADFVSMIVDKLKWQTPTKSYQILIKELCEQAKERPNHYNFDNFDDNFDPNGTLFGYQGDYKSSMYRIWTGSPNKTGTANINIITWHKGATGTDHTQTISILLEDPQLIEKIWEFIEK